MIKLSIKFVFVFFSQNRVLRPDRHLFGLKTAVFNISTQFPQWGIYIYPCWYWKSKIRKNHIHQTKLPVWPIYGSTVTFMAFKLKSMAFPIKSTPNDPNEGKYYKILKFWVLAFGFGLQKFFRPFFIFLRSLMLKKSSGMQEQYVWVVFHPNQIPNQNSHSNSLCVTAAILIEGAVRIYV